MLRTVLRADAIFELVLAAYVIIAVVAWPEGVRMPDPASDPLLVTVAIVLVAAGAAIWWLSSSPGRVFVIVLAVANAAGGALFLTWLAAADGFSEPAGGLLTAVSTVLILLALAEALALTDSVAG
jgi:hypothetical protein